MDAAPFILSFFLVAGHVTAVTAGLWSLAEVTPYASSPVATAALASTTSNSAAANAMRNVNNLQAALSNITGVTGRPVSYKNIEAARYIAYASGSMMVPTEPSTIQQLSNESSALFAWQNSTAAVIMAFSANNATTGFNASESGFAPTSVDTLLRGNFAGAYPPNAVSTGTFLGLATGIGAQGLALTDVVANLSSNAEVRRVVCTGYGNGGALAQLCGIWAAVTYPNAHIRVIAFGAPPVGNIQFSFALQQLVDLSYLWSLSSDLKITNSTSGDRGPAQPIYSLSAGNIKSNKGLVPNSFDAYVAAILAYSTDTSGDSSLVGGGTKEKGGNIGLTIDATGSYDGPSSSQLAEILNSTLTIAAQFNSSSADEQTMRQANAAMKAKAASKGCPPLLCQIRPASEMACGAYLNGTNTIGKGSVTVGPVESTAAQVAVDWNATSRTATFAFRGTASQAGWIIDAKVALQKAKTNSAFDQFFPNVRVHQGFLESLLSVTQQAANPQQNITAVLDKLAGGVAKPDRVIITGHSLGAAIASVAGPWASLTWPAADVHVVTFGSPLPGNSQFAELYKLLAGRQNRMIREFDVVPTTPQFNGFVPIDLARWARDNTSIILEDRPETPPDKLNWDDHSCLLYVASMYSAPYTTAPTDLGGVLVNATTATGGSPSAKRDAVASTPGSGGPAATTKTATSATGITAPAWLFCIVVAVAIMLHV